MYTTKKVLRFLFDQDPNESRFPVQVSLVILLSLKSIPKNHQSTNQFITIGLLIFIDSTNQSIKQAINLSVLCTWTWNWAV